LFKAIDEKGIESLRRNFSFSSQPKAYSLLGKSMNRMSIPESKVEHQESRGIRRCRIFPELLPILDEAFEILGDESEYVVAAPQNRAVANTAMG
jgi:hypothetical protein